MQQDLDAQAAIVAENSAAPLTFNDTQAAGETLAVMRLRPRVAMACLYKSDQLFATFDRDAGVRCPGRPPAKGAITATSYTLIRPVTVAVVPVTSTGAVVVLAGPVVVTVYPVTGASPTGAVHGRA